MRRLKAPYPELTAVTPINMLVISQHDAVRRELVEYLRRTPGMSACGEAFSTSAIFRSRPDVLVLDLSQISTNDLQKAFTVARHVGARLIALASMPDPAIEQQVLAAGGTYCLKSADPGGLAKIIGDLLAP